MNPNELQSSPLRSWASRFTQETSQPAKTGKDSLLTPEFKQLLATSLLGMSMPGSANQGAALAPLMLVLIEQLLTEEVEAADTNIPRGRPIEGRLTQNAHQSHMALDFGAPVGTPVQATMDGRVVYAGWNNEGYGNLVIVENGSYRTYYAHLSKIPVQVGQMVRAKEVIALSGNTGNSTGPHLHYEVRLNMQPVNPASFTFP